MIKRFTRRLAQSGSASGLGPEGREFESLISDHFFIIGESIMAAVKGKEERRRVHKGTCQNGSKSASANKCRKDHKKYRGQGR